MLLSCDSWVLYVETYEQHLRQQPCGTSAVHPMGVRHMSDDITYNRHHFHYTRRRFLGAAAMTIAGAQLGMMTSAEAQPAMAQPAELLRIKSRTYTSFGPLKQINAGLLNVGYAEAGPINAPAVVLLHGWPYDIYSYVDVAPLLASAGYRVIVPYLRGYGTTRFLSSDTVRNG